MKALATNWRFGFVAVACAALALAAGCGDDGGGVGTCEPGPGVICTVYGTGISGLSDDGLPALDTDFYLPQDLTFGPDGNAYVLDWNNHRIRVVEDGVVRTIVGTGQLGDASPGHGREVNLNHPTHVTFSPAGDMIIAAWHNSKVLRYGFGTDEVETICGTGARSFGGDGGPALTAVLDLPVATAFSPDGELLYIADQANQRIRAIDGDDVITTIAGNGTAGFSGDGGPALEASINLPVSQSAPPAGRIDIDRDGNLYLADTLNNRVRRIDASDGTISTIAGNGERGFSGDGGPATQASLNLPADVEVDGAGNVYIADTLNSCVRRVDTSGVITTVAGRCGEMGWEGDGGLAADALLNRPYGVEVGPDGSLFVADTHNHVIRVVYP